MKLEPIDNQRQKPRRLREVEAGWEREMDTCNTWTENPISIWQAGRFTLSRITLAKFI